jgi:DNA-binding transcriptional MerR regulator
MPQGLQIGVVAHQAGLTVDAIRFYEKSGLLKRPPRTEGGFRLFRRQDVEDLKFIRKAQDLGFSLQEIRELLLLQGESLEACEHVRELLGQKLASVRGKIAELQKLDRSLDDSLRKCNRRLRRAGATHEGCCPVLEELRRTNGHQEN